jgi:predicted nucleic acid-binding Zn ribbon protein
MDVPSCRLCGAALPEDGSLRCPNCGLHQAAELGRPGYRRLALGLVGVYVLTTLLVLLTRG